LGETRKALSSFFIYFTLDSPGGRAYPDVAAQGVNFTIISNQTSVLVSGTSASAPVSKKSKLSHTP
jgi:hypothetical protein